MDSKDVASCAIEESTGSVRVPVPRYDKIRYDTIRYDTRLSLAYLCMTCIIMNNG